MADDNKRKYLFGDYDDYEDIYSDYDPSSFNFDLLQGLGGLDYAGSEFAYKDLDFAGNVLNDPELFAAFAKANPEDAALLKDLMGGDYGFAPVGGGSPADAASGVYDPNDQSAADTGVPVGGSEKTSILDKLKKGIADITGLDKDTIGELGKYGLLAGVAKMAYDDAQRAREEARGYSAPGGVAKQMVRGPSGGVSYRKVGKAAGGGIGSLDMTTKQPFYLGGPTDGMADEVPAHIDNKRPAALSDGEFVIPADVVSHLGNGNSNAGAKRLYEMMDDIREARTGNKNQGIQINPNKFMPR